MRKSFSIAFIGAAVCLSCAKESFSPEESVKTVIAVGIENSKTTIGESEGGKHKIYWANGDVLNANGLASEALTDVGDKQTSASFTFNGIVTAPVSFLYPSACYKTATTISLPKDQSAAVADLPLYGYSASSLQVDLKALTAALRISLRQGDDTDEIKFIEISSSTQALSGTFTINYQDGTITSTAAAADSKVRLSANCALSAEDAKTFVFSIPAGSYPLTVKVVDVNAHCMTKTLTGKTFTAGKYIILPELTFAPTTTEFDVHITSAGEWNSFADNFNKWKYTDDPTVSVSIDNDIDFDGVTPTLIGAYGTDADNYCSALIDGNGHSFKNIVNCPTPLVAALNTKGVIRNLTIDESCSFSSDPDISRQTHFGPFCEYLKGTLEGCINKASVTISPSASTTYTLANYVGGLVGRIREGKIDNCANYGAITLGANYTVSADNKKALGVGGLAGYISNTLGSIENSVNEGSISVAATANPIYIGGVAGQLNGSVSSCSNKGGISISTTRASNDPCKNIYIGGITGILPANASVSSCTNSGSITSTSNVKIQMSGGVVGSVTGGAMENNTNSGDITYSAATRQIMVGGLIGSLDNGGTYTFTGTPATGKITISAIESNASSSFLYAGGLIGRVKPLNNPVIRGKSLASVCDLSITAAGVNFCKGGMGGIIGALSLESESNPTDVTIEYCHVSFKKNAGVRAPIGEYSFWPVRMGMGGILGYALTSVKINNCSFESTLNITGSKKSNGYMVDCGGIAGRLDGGDSEISNCSVPNSAYIYNHHYNNSPINDSGNATGGIIGRAAGNSIKITGCTCNSIVYAYRSAVGGVGGRLENATVKGCTVTGAISYGNYAGGLAGYASASTFGGTSEADACTFNSASGIKSGIDGSCLNYAGGLAGQTVSSCKFINCKSYFGTSTGITAGPKGDTANGNSPGSLIGNSDSGTTITSCKAGGKMNCIIWGMPGDPSLTSVTLDSSTVLTYAIGNLAFTPEEGSVTLWDGN